MAKIRKKRSKVAAVVKPQERLIDLGNTASDVAKIARRHGKSLSGSNFYADKMAELRANATNEFERFASNSVGDTSAVAELMESVFSAHVKPKVRSQALRDLQFTLKTKWKNVAEQDKRSEDGGVFPLVTLNDTKRGYLVTVGRQANGCYVSGWYDACAVMMRRLLESSIIEAFEGKGIATKIKDTHTGDFFQLTGLVDAALAEGSWNLPRNVRRDLKQLRDLGHRSAHNRYYLGKKSDIDNLRGVFREAVEAFLHLGKLL